jgi:uncharacterized protein
MSEREMIKTMQVPLDVLKQLQGVDKEIYALKAEQEMIPTQVRNFDVQVENQKTHVNDATERFKEAKMSLHKKELELKEREENIKKYDVQLSQVKTNKEYSSLQNEISNLKADCSLLEEEIIRLLDEVQNAEVALHNEQQRLKVAEEEYATKKKELEVLTTKHALHISELTQKKDALARTVDKNIYAMYERISKNKNGVALAKVHNESCGACQMRLLPQLINEIMMNDKLVVCGTCARILYMEPT